VLVVVSLPSCCRRPAFVKCCRRQLEGMNIKRLDRRPWPSRTLFNYLPAVQ
jgi:hypothetical protein